ncbi:MAG: TonB-dependent receptor [Candidatus Marinimicrobia bacterium]|nr:TonB-dependent receptor [Candidatus Neomarinimicrobiota bacterium]
MNSKNINMILAVFLVSALSNNVFAGTTGKITGQVTDSNSGEGLPGVNIVLIRYNVGAASNDEGYYTIINVPPGKYDLKVSMIGYADVIVKDVSVNIDRTTKQDVSLSTEALTGEMVTIFAQKPLVEKNLTSTNYYVDSETIESLPVTEMAEIIGIQAGVITGEGGEMHFRGGREREVAYLLDGIPVTNYFSQSGGISVTVENENIQELQIISGTFNAEYGSAQSGIVNIVTKRVSQDLHGSIRFYGADFVSNNTDIFLGIDQINPLSENDILATLTGPLLSDKIGFLGTVRYNNFESHHGYQRRFNPIDGWVINTYRKWYTENFSEGLASTGRISIPDSLMTGDGKMGPLGWSKNLSYSLKLSYYPTPTTSFTYSVFGSHNKNQDGGLSRRYQPDALTTYNEISTHHFFSLKQSPRENFFWNLNYSYQYNHGDDYYRKDNKIAEYPGDEGIQPISSSSYGFSLGTTDGGYYNRDGKNYRKVYLVSGNLNWQINRQNFVKAGFLFKQYKVNTYYYPLIATEQWNYYYYDPSVDGADYEWPEYWNLMMDHWENWNTTYNTSKYRFPSKDEITRYRDYTINPLETALYIQDKLELDDFIFNVGLRLDVFYPNEKVIKNKRIESYLLGNDDNLFDAPAQYQWSPRLGFAFPISDRGAFHVAYGHFFQMPSFEKMYSEPINVLTPIQLNGMQLGDASLKPEKTISYEIGLQQQITSEYAVDLTAYSKDIRNQLGIELVTTVDAIGYTKFVNRDFGNVKGFTLALEKLQTGLFWGSIDYTYQYAKGSASSPEFLQVVQISNRLGGEPVQFIERQILPFDWDQRHTLNVTVIIGRSRDWMVSILGNLGSGLPYSPLSVEQLDLPERDFKNSARKPVRWVADLKATKFFRHNGLTYSVFLIVDNIFDHLNEMTVYSTSGRATHNAILPEERKIRDKFIVQEGIFSPEEIDVRPYWFSQPRVVRIGLKVSF